MPASVIALLELLVERVRRPDRWMISCDRNSFLGSAVKTGSENSRRSLLMNLLDQLRSMTVVVADTGDIESIAQYQPRDTTTNPSLLLKAAQMPHYQRPAGAGHRPRPGR